MWRREREITDARLDGFDSDADASWLRNRKLLCQLNNSSFQRKAHLAYQSSLAYLSTYNKTFMCAIVWSCDCNGIMSKSN
jgi:hypothetical protein